MPERGLIHREKTQGTQIKEPHGLGVVSEQKPILSFGFLYCFFPLLPASDFLDQLAVGFPQFGHFLRDFNLEGGMELLLLTMELHSLGKQGLEMCHSKQQEPGCEGENSIRHEAGSEPEVKRPAGLEHMKQSERSEGGNDEPTDALCSEAPNESQSIRGHSELQDTGNNIEEGKTV